jgi:hypothetical protein
MKLLEIFLSTRTHEKCLNGDRKRTTKNQPGLRSVQA